MKGGKESSVKALDDEFARNSGLFLLSGDETHVPLGNNEVYRYSTQNLDGCLYAQIVFNV